MAQWVFAAFGLLVVTRFTDALDHRCSRSQMLSITDALEISPGIQASKGAQTKGLQLCACEKRWLHLTLGGSREIDELSAIAEDQRASL